MSDSQQIVPAPVLPLVTPEEAAAQWARFEALKSKLLVDDDYQLIAGKRHFKRSGLRKLGVYFGISDRLLKEERTDRDDGSFNWRVVVQAIAPNGRSCVGVGACDSRERNFAHVEHDIYATAHTRAKNRAISDMIAGGAVSAEELTTGSMDVGPEPTKTREELVMVRFLKDLQAFVGPNGKAYGPFKVEDIASIPRENASALVKQGIAIVAEGSPTGGPPEHPPTARAEALQSLELKTKGGVVVGSIALKKDEIDIDFAPPLDMSNRDMGGLVRNFLVRRILDNMKASAEKEGRIFSHEGIERDGLLYGVSIIGDVTERQFKELISPLTWLLNRASERAAP